MIRKIALLISIILSIPAAALAAEGEEVYIDLFNRTDNLVAELQGTLKLERPEQLPAIEQLGEMTETIYSDFEKLEIPQPQRFLIDQCREFVAERRAHLISGAPDFHPEEHDPNIVLVLVEEEGSK